MQRLANAQIVVAAILMDVRLSELSEDTSVQLRFASELSEASEQDPAERQPVRPQSARQRPIFTPRGTRITVAAHLWKQSERPSRPSPQVYE